MSTDTKHPFAPIASTICTYAWGLQQKEPGRGGRKLVLSIPSRLGHPGWLRLDCYDLAEVRLPLLAEREI